MHDLYFEFVFVLAKMLVLFKIKAFSLRMRISHTPAKVPKAS